MANTLSLPTPSKEVFNFLGQDLTFEFNKLAFRADAALTITKGETVVFVTVGTDKKPIDADFVPLSIEYLEKYYAGGIISSSRFVKREMRPSDSAVLKARLVDHAVRSLFPKSWRKPVSVIITVMAYDGINDPEQLAVIGASTALMISSVPFNGPSASIKAGLDHEGNYVWAPTVAQEEELLMDMSVSIVNDRILNIEGWADEVQEDKIIGMMEEAVVKLQPMLQFQKDLAAKYGKAKQEYAEIPAPEALINKIKENHSAEIQEALLDKEDRQTKMSSLKQEIAKEMANEIRPEAEEAYTSQDIDSAVEYVARKIVRKMALEGEQRTSGRALDEIRELRVEVGVLPRVHGSALFSRGITQCLSILTLGSARVAQTLESFEGEEIKAFMHHYNSPNYSYGDAGRYSYYPGRREIGHGNIGENALRKMVPSTTDFPYTIRMNSEIMSSNGSTSMAATCASCLALLDGGVPIKNLVAGIALGLVTDDSNLENYKLFVDMEDVEDFYGDMDFKVTGSERGVTAIQLDNKLMGVPVSILAAAFAKSKGARLQILDAMKAVIAAPRADLSKYAPKVEIIQIKQDQIGELIGPGGKVIKGIIEQCNGQAEINIEEDGRVVIMAVDPEMRAKAVALVKEIVQEAEIGMTYDGEVDKVMEYGVFVDVTPKISGLVHVSELANDFVKDVNSLYKQGDKVRVKVVGKDNLGRLKFSIKQADK